MQSSFDPTLLRMWLGLVPPPINFLHTHNMMTQVVTNISNLLSFLFALGPHYFPIMPKNYECHEMGQH